MHFIEKLKIGDSIGIFSPSALITDICPRRFERSKEFLQNKGFEIIEGNLTGENDFYRSGSIKERAEGLIEDSLKNCAIIERSFSLLKVSGVLGEREIPFIAEFDCSHTHPMMTLPIGCNIELNATKKTVTIISRYEQ